MCNYPPNLRANMRMRFAQPFECYACDPKASNDEIKLLANRNGDTHICKPLLCARAGEFSTSSDQRVGRGISPR